MEDEVPVKPVSLVSACISGVVAGSLLVVVGFLAAPPPANELAIPRPAIEPVCVLLAAAAAAAVPCYRLRGSIGLTLALALGTAVFTYILSQWVGHWGAVGLATKKGAVSLAEMTLRRDLMASFFGVVAGAVLGTLLGKE